MKTPITRIFKKKHIVELNDLIKPTKNRRLTPQLKRANPIRADVELEELATAIRLAKSPDYPNRLKLYAIYERIIHDSHLQSQIRTAKLSVLKSDFVIKKNNKINDKAKDLLAQSWFDKFIDLALDAEFWGHSLIEFSTLNQNNKFTDVTLIPRTHVKPEKGIVVAEPTDDKGIAYRNYATQFALIEIGDKYDLGLLETAAREVIVKNYARTDWSQASEKYGMPLLKIKTNTSDSKEIDRLEEMAQNFAYNGYIIINSEDDAEIIQIKSTDFYKIYLENIQSCNENISKLINGQTGTSDEKAYVGSAEVHERILNNYTFSRLRKMQYIVNNQLIPFLIKWGYPLDGYQFQYTDLLPKDQPVINENLSELFS